MKKLDMREQSLLALAIAKEKSFDEKIGYTGAVDVGADICCSRRILEMAEIPGSAAANGSGKKCEPNCTGLRVTAKQEIGSPTAASHAQRPEYPQND
jgi:hypothetical protein